jgi:hypothetical protein
VAYAPAAASGAVFSDFQDIDGERGLEWRRADSLLLREFMYLGERDLMPDHSRLSPTRSLKGESPSPIGRPQRLKRAQAAKFPLNINAYSLRNELS